MASKYQDKILLGLSLLLVAGGVVGARIYHQKKVLPVLDKEAAEVQTDKPYKRVVEKKVELPPAAPWNQPEHQRSGQEWIYEVFTSPYIFFDKEKNEMGAVPPVQMKRAPEFGLELLAVQPGPFRLQLVGYKGDDGIFQNLPGHETVIARAGHKFPDINLEVRDFQVKSIALDDTNPASLRIPVAVAIVADTKTGEMVTLTNRQKAMGGLPVALLRVSDVPGVKDRGKLLSAMVVGEEYTDANTGAVFHLDSVTETPPTVLATKKMAGAADTPKLLSPVPPKAPRKPATLPADQPPATPAAPASKNQAPAAPADAPAKK